MSWDFQSTAIVGSGAIGLYYGGRLAATGEDVRFLLRSDIRQISRDGLQVESIHGDFQRDQIQAFPTASDIGPVDLVVVAWKATANRHLKEVLPPLLHERTQVLTLQNGLGNCESVAEVVGEERVMGGLCFVCINRVSPGRVRHTGGGRVTIGEWRKGESGRAEEVTRRWKNAGIQAVAVKNMEQSQWEKLVWNIPFNGLSIAEGGVTTDQLLATPEKEAEVRAIMKEVITAGRALGFELDEGLIDSNIDRTRPMGAYRTSSMIDFVEGREVELTPIWVEPLRRAAEVGVEMPRTHNLFERIRAQLGMRD